jgi:hypothetical protein
MLLSGLKLKTNKDDLDILTEMKKQMWQDSLGSANI